MAEDRQNLTTLTLPSCLETVHELAEEVKTVRANWERA